jgi:LysM repeat protein
MRHDAKLGLALGMLVIGFAIAFCFPRPPASAPWLQLEVPEPIADSNLDFLPIRAYQPPSVSAAPQGAPATDSIPAPSVADPAQAFAKSPPPLVALQPGTPLGEVLSVSAAPPGSAAGVVPSAAAPAASQTYKVRAGDTLSGIASKFLGSSGRYLEIYEANQDRLGTPDNLHVGMELKIPPRDGAKPAPPETEPTQVAERPQTTR